MTDNSAHARRRPRQCRNIRFELDEGGVTAFMKYRQSTDVLSLYPCAFTRPDAWRRPAVSTSAPSYLK